MKNLRQTYVIKAPVKKVWQALVNQNIIYKWGGGPAKMDDKEGTDFKLWGGDIFGKNIKIIKEKELTQDWLEKGWEKPSLVTFKLAPRAKNTELILIHKNIPDDRVDDIAAGWKDYYLGPMKDYLEKNNGN
jgi:activator of HSP90 ATPase